jgi:hypothetical protein
MVPNPLSMKTFFTVFLFLLFFHQSRAAIRTAIGNTGQGWSVAGNWSPSGIPQNGDTVLVPAGITITVKTNIYNTAPNLVIRVFGRLHFDPSGKLELGPASSVNIYPNGYITSTGSPSSVIKIGNVNKYQGTSGTIVGPAFASAASGISPNGFSQGVLAVKFQRFLVKANTKQQAQLNWTVSEEFEITGYDIERSSDSRNWRTVYTQPSTISNEAIKQYAYTDSFPPNGIIYYRIKAKESNGSIYYSSTETLNRNALRKFTVYPNPVSSQLNISIEASAVQSPVSITIYTSAGRKTDQFTYDRLPSKLELNISHLPKGTYRVILNDAAGTKQDQTIIVY